MLLPAPGLSTSKKILVTKGIATRSKGASDCLAQGLDLLVKAH